LTLTSPASKYRFIVFGGGRVLYLRNPEATIRRASREIIGRNNQAGITPEV